MMGFGRDEKRVAAMFDGEAPETAELKALLDADPELAAYYAGVQRLREGAEAVRGEAEIGDAQFPAFMRGIRDGIEQPVRGGHRGFWAVVSMGAAAMLAAISAIVVMTGGPSEVRAHTVIEEVSTDIEGGVTSSFISEGGTATVWVEAPAKDIL